MALLLVSVCALALRATDTVSVALVTIASARTVLRGFANGKLTSGERERVARAGSLLLFACAGRLLGRLIAATLAGAVVGIVCQFLGIASLHAAMHRIGTIPVVLIGSVVMTLILILGRGRRTQ